MKKDAVAGACWKCGRALGPLDYGRQDACPGCRSDAHVCRNCIHYERGLNNDCRESSADRVVEKDRANFCDFFKPRMNGPAPGADPARAAREAAEALFRKK